jgi:hypothetical protein
MDTAGPPWGRGRCPGAPSTRDTLIQSRSGVQRTLTRSLRETILAQISVVIPAYNESAAVGDTVKTVQETFRDTGHEFEILVVDDGSADDTSRRAGEAGAAVIRHPRNIGYGNAILTGASQAKHPYVAITDADGTYPISELPSMLDEAVGRDLDMLVGARRGKQYEGSILKGFARAGFKFLAEFTCGRKIPDINSGLRVIRRSLVLEFAGVLCGGFSFTTTITIIAMMTHRFVDYRGIDYHARVGKSHVHYFRDALRVAQILVMTILLFNPIKFFLLYAMGVLGVGLCASVLVLLVPRLAPGIVVFGLFFIGACVVMGLGLLSEQRRASQLGPWASAVARGSWRSAM